MNKNSSSGTAVKISGKAMNRLSDRTLSAHTNQVSKFCIDLNYTYNTGSPRLTANGGAS